MSHDDATVRKNARDLLQSGRLPARAPDGVWSVVGSGQDRCLVCGELIALHQYAIEAAFRGSDGSGSLYFHFHVGCYWALESERRSVEPASDAIDHPGSPRLARGTERQRWLDSSSE